MANEYDDKVLALRKSVQQADTGESDTGAPDTGERRVSPGVERQYQLQKMYEAYKADPDKGRFSSPAEWLKNRQAEQEEIRQVVDKLEAPQTTPVANYRVTASHMKAPLTGDPSRQSMTTVNLEAPEGHERSKSEMSCPKAPSPTSPPKASQSSHQKKGMSSCCLSVTGQHPNQARKPTRHHPSMTSPNRTSMRCWIN